MNTNATSPRFVILAPIDGSPATDQVVASASRFAQMVTGGELHLLHVVDRVADAETTLANDVASDLKRERDRMVETAARRARDLGVPRLLVHVVDDRPAHGILATAAELGADLILVGTHARRGLARIVMGSVAEEIVRKASCPVLVVREKSYGANAVPEIEPPCPACIEAQHTSRGAKMWCARHSEHHAHGHLHYEFAEPFAVGSMLVRP